MQKQLTPKQKQAIAIKNRKEHGQEGHKKNDHHGHGHPNKGNTLSPSKDKTRLTTSDSSNLYDEEYDKLHKDSRNNIHQMNTYLEFMNQQRNNQEKTIVNVQHYPAMPKGLWKSLVKNTYDLFDKKDEVR